MKSYLATLFPFVLLLKEKRSGFLITLALGLYSAALSPCFVYAATIETAATDDVVNEACFGIDKVVETTSIKGLAKPILREGLVFRNCQNGFIQITQLQQVHKGQEHPSKAIHRRFPIVHAFRTPNATPDDYSPSDKAWLDSLSAISHGVIERSNTRIKFYDRGLMLDLYNLIFGVMYENYADIENYFDITNGGGDCEKTVKDCVENRTLVPRGALMKKLIKQISIMQAPQQSTIRVEQGNNQTREVLIEKGEYVGDDASLIAKCTNKLSAISADESSLSRENAQPFLTDEEAQLMCTYALRTISSEEQLNVSKRFREELFQARKSLRPGP